METDLHVDISGEAKAYASIHTLHTYSYIYCAVQYRTSEELPCIYTHRLTNIHTVSALQYAHSPRILMLTLLRGVSHRPYPYS